MSYLTESRQHLSLAALHYSADENVLTVGNKTLPLESAWLEDQSPWNLVEFDGTNQLENSTVCLNPHSKPIGAPRFHEWLGRMSSKESVYLGTIKVMRSVFATLRPDIEIPETSNPGSFGFGMSINERNHVHLLTGGFCACLGENAQGHWVNDRDWQEGYCEYGWHNIDDHSQAWSLLAGMGHLACLAAQEV
jgi:hypothetical protein